MGHSRLSPSSAGQWVHCPGSVSMRACFPETGRSQAAEEGTACHWVGSEVLLGRGTDPFEGRVAPNNVVITTEMVDAAKVYVGAVRSLVPLTAKITVEEKLVIKQIHENCYGTPDCWFFNVGQNELHIWDLKYGYGIVEPVENWQLICYAIGALGKVANRNTKITVHIVQPRVPHPMGYDRTWCFMGEELCEYADQLKNAALKALSATPGVVSGDHCRYCSALHACPAARKAALYACDYSDRAIPAKLSPEGMGVDLMILRKAETRLKSMISAREGQIIATQKAGINVPGWAQKHGKGRIIWDKPVEEVLALGEIMGIDLKAPEKAITPAKAGTAGLDSALIKAYSHAPTTGITLVPAEKSLASNAFSK